MAEWEDAILQRHVVFNIFCICNYISLYSISLKGLFRHNSSYKI
jgi:hypothetical protein